MSPEEVLKLPADVLKKMPLTKPPPGIASNFTTPDDRGYLLVVVPTILLTFGMTAFSVRMYVKIFITKKLSWDDRESET